MIHSRRVFSNDTGGFADQSIKLNSFRTGSYVGSFDGSSYLYIGSYYPLSSVYFDINTPANVDTNLTVEYWSGSDTWIEAYDSVDFTKTTGSMKQSGYVSLTRDRDFSWVREQYSKDVDGLANTNVYDFYWLRFSFAPDATIGWNYIGHRFCNDDSLYSYYPDFNNQVMKNQWEQGFPAGTKTDWKEQQFMASEAIIRDMVRKGIIDDSAQIISQESLEEVCIHKTAELIYAGLGKAFKEDRDSARAMYDRSFEMRLFKVDSNKDGDLSHGERLQSTGFMKR